MNRRDILTGFACGGIIKGIPEVASPPGSVQPAAVIPLPGGQSITVVINVGDVSEFRSTAFQQAQRLVAALKRAPR